jgi:hypothetical protein
MIAMVMTLADALYAYSFVLLVDRICHAVADLQLAWSAD